ncbi:hypothetical protein, partial [Escherichia coli]|uniref:hypothetical protein n=1 Tax=Escherichia coli TaxID=562 RepID=UPI0021C005C2
AQRMRQSLSNGLFNPRGNRAAYAVPNLIVVILTNFQDARGFNNWLKTESFPEPPAWLGVFCAQQKGLPAQPFPVLMGVM